MHNGYNKDTYCLWLPLWTIEPIPETLRKNVKGKKSVSGSNCWGTEISSWAPDNLRSLASCLWQRGRSLEVFIIGYHWLLLELPPPRVSRHNHYWPIVGVGPALKCPQIIEGLSSKTFSFSGCWLQSCGTFLWSVLYEVTIPCCVSVGT